MRVTSTVSVTPYSKKCLIIVWPTSSKYSVLGFWRKKSTHSVHRWVFSSSRWAFPFPLPCCTQTSTTRECSQDQLFWKRSQKQNTIIRRYTCIYANCCIFRIFRSQPYFRIKISCNPSSPAGLIPKSYQWRSVPVHSTGTSYSPPSAKTLFSRLYYSVFAQAWKILTPNTVIFTFRHGGSSKQDNYFLLRTCTGVHASQYSGLFSFIAAQQDRISQIFQIRNRFRMTIHSGCRFPGNLSQIQLGSAGLYWVYSALLYSALIRSALLYSAPLYLIEWNCW